MLFLGIYLFSYRTLAFILTIYDIHARSTFVFYWCQKIRKTPAFSNHPDLTHQTLLQDIAVFSII